MTRPLFEPNTQRALAKQGYGQAQLFRRPAPALGEATIPAFYAIQKTAFTSVADSLDTVLLWDVWINTDPTVFDHTQTGNKLNSVKLLQLDGRYTLTCSIEWAVNWNATMRIILAGDYDFNLEQDYVGRAGGWTSNPTATFSLIYEAPFEAPDGAAAVQWQVAQHSGLTRSTDFGTFMQITYDGPISTEQGS